MKTDELTDRVLPQFFPTHWLKSADIVHTDFPSRIRVGYVLRSEGAYSYVLEEEFASLSLSLEDLHAAALRNLDRLASANISVAKVADGAEGWIWTEEDNFAAVRILLLRVQDIFREELGGEFLFAISNRDDCICWSLTQSIERQKKHAQDALDDFLKDDFGLTPDILLCSEGSFQLHRKQTLAEPDTSAAM